MKHIKRKAKLPESASTPLADRDKDAFTHAIEQMRQHSEARCRQIDDKLTREGFEAAGQFASYFCQCATLQLKAWQAPPCHVRGDVVDPNVYGCRPGEIQLRDRLVSAGLSCFEPDPIQALAQVARNSTA